MAVEAYLSGWPLSSWISPSGALFFLFVNVLIGAIVVTSSARGHPSGAGRATAASTRRLCRSASSMVLDRLRSFSMFSVHPVPMEMEDYYSTATSSPELEEAEDEQQPQPAVTETESPAAASVATPDADGGASSEIAKKEAEAAAAGEGMVAAERQSQEKRLAETTMEVQRRRAPAACRCRRETEEALAEGKAALNARADSFIRRFREDLRLERVNSIINYTGRTLRRGGSAAGAPPAAQ